MKKKLSIVVPVYYNEDNLVPLYQDIKEQIIDVIDFDYEIIMVDDGSKDHSWDVMKKLAAQDTNVKIYHLSRNFGSHAAILCGLSQVTGDCAVVKAADLQEPTEMILEMYDRWTQGYNVVLAVRKDREESVSQKLFANLYYWLVRKTALPQMPKGGFDTFLLDVQVIRMLECLNEKNSAITGQILWSGYKTDVVYYVRRARKVGKSRWTLRKKIRLVMDTLFSFSNFPIIIVTSIGTISVTGSIIWMLIVFISKLQGKIQTSGFTTMFIFQLLSFGIIMMTMGVLGGYLWRTFDSSRNRPVYIVEELREKKEGQQNEKHDQIVEKDVGNI